MCCRCWFGGGGVVPPCSTIAASPALQRTLSVDFKWAAYALMKSLTGTSFTDFGWNSAMVTTCARRTAPGGWEGRVSAATPGRGWGRS
jgi:hypothetical protein